ncbi:MAG: PKD domain-containing protein, partial [Candidatus Thermoplasmatota archaeon]|nr:PKD domain-containing protein [Candidatus Thermoplasmatota archaeon]
IMEPCYNQHLDGAGIEVFFDGEPWGGEEVYTFEEWTFSFYGLEDATILWDMDDGTMLTGRSVEHSYARSGYYYVTAIAHLPDGESVYRQAIVYVCNQPPVAVIDVYQMAALEFSVAGTPGNTVRLEILEDGNVVDTFEQTRTAEEPVVDTLLFPVRSGREYSLLLTHSGRGSNPVTITLLGEDTVTGGTNQVLYNVALNHQQHNVAVLDIDEGLTEVLKDNRRVWFDGSQSIDPDGEIVEYRWYLEDNTTLSGILVNHVFSEIGDYYIWLDVEDDEGAYNITYTSFHLASRIGEIIEPIKPGPRPPIPGPWPPRPWPPEWPIPPWVVVDLPADVLYIEYRCDDDQTWTTIDTITYYTDMGRQDRTWTAPDNINNLQVRFRLVGQTAYSPYFPDRPGNIYLDNIILE